MHRIRFAQVAAAVVIGAALTTSAFGASIGLNFTGGGNGGSPAISLATTDLAGVVPQTNWNNQGGGSGAAVTGLVDNTGTVVAGLSLTYTAGGTYSSVGTATVAPADGNEKLNTGFIFGNSTVTVAGVPYPTYDVYVYELNDAAGRVETTTLTNPTQGPFYGSSATPSDTGHVDQNATTAYTYLQSTSTDPAAATANGDYVKFAGVTGNTFTFTTAAPGNGYLNGFQIVQQVPEPAAGLLAAGGLGLLARRRGRRAA